MIFNSAIFLVFFTTVFFLYWFVFNQKVKYQNLLLLASSYFFYAWADWRFLSFLIVVSALNYFLGLYIDKHTKYKKLFVAIGILQGIGLLAYFKYFNFFIDSFSDLFNSFGWGFKLQTLNIIVPLGISFFTFRTISYILDIDKKKIHATRDWVVFFNYVSFFPSVLSGPIDKAKLLVPQLEKKREFHHHEAIDGLRQILWGLFKKIVIADNCATITSEIFNNYSTHSGSTLVLAAFFYTIQIYADFSGYSDMAIGIARLLGFSITKNFDFPFFSQNIAEFWRRWHISLTAWLTEYVFTPLSIAFRDYGKLGLILAILINFTLIGIWHGANWTYILFGFLHGCYFIPLILSGTMNKKKKIAKERLLPSISEFIKIVGTFVLVMITFILFKSANLENAYNYCLRIVSFSIFSIPYVPGGMVPGLVILFFIILMIIVEWMQRDKDHALQITKTENNNISHLAFYYFLIFAIFLMHSSGVNQFIYFKF